MAPMPMTDKGLIRAVKNYPFLYDNNNASFHDTKKRDGAWMEIASKFDKTTGLVCKRRWQVLRDCFRKQLRKRRLSQGAECGKKWRYEVAMDFLVPFITERNPDKCSNVSSLAYVPPENETENENESDEQSSEFNPDFDGDIKYAILNAASGEYLPQNAEGLLASCAKDREEQGIKATVQKNESNLERRNMKRCIEELTDVITTPLPSSSSKRPRGDSEKPRDDDALTLFFRAMAETVRTFKYPLQIEIKGKIANLVNEYELRNHTG
nr:PREDICTED: uncharacterized protein LOC109035709 [Bemisia tabaci]